MSSLKPKHIAALQLLKTKKGTTKEIAKSLGMSYDYLRDLMSGKANTGNVGKEFSAEFREYEKELDKKIRAQTKNCADLTTQILGDWLKIIQNKTTKTKEEVKLVKDIQGVIAKSRPSIEIGTFAYTKGLSAEDLFNEYKRLKGVAQASLIRNRISSSEQGGTGEDYMAPGPGDKTEEISETPPLRTSGPSEEVPPESSSDTGYIRGE